MELTVSNELCKQIQPRAGFLQEALPTIQACVVDLAKAFFCFECLENSEAWFLATSFRRTCNTLIE